MAQLDRLLAVMAGDKTGVLTLHEGTPARVERADVARRIPDELGRCIDANLAMD